MTLLDWTMLGIILLSVVLAAAQGFFFEIFSLAGAVLGYLLAMWEYPRAAAWYLPYVKAQQYANLAGFLTIFFSVVILAGMVGRLTRWAVNEVGLRWVDRLLGAAFGLVRGIVIVSVSVMAIAAFAPDSHSLARSELSGYFLLAARSASWAAPTELRARVREGALAIRNMGLGASSHPGQQPESASGAPELKAQPEAQRPALPQTELRADSGKKMRNTSDPRSAAKQ